MVAFSQVRTSCAVYTLPAQVFNAQEQGDIPWLAHAHAMRRRCQCPALEDSRQVIDGGAYTWCQGQLSWQSRGCRAGVLLLERGRRGEVVGTAPPGIAPSCSSRPPKTGLCEPSGSTASSSHLSYPMTRAASAGSLFILVSACAAEKPLLAASPAGHLNSLLSNCFSFFWVAKPLKQAENLSVIAFAV